MAATTKKKNGLWFKDAIIYELSVRAFYDSNADGIGDFPGLIQKLDYLEELGINTIWLLPFYPSPLRDDGYDVAEYCDVHPDYGTLADFKSFLKEAHNRGIKVITELILNHTSDQHPWFKKSRTSRFGSKARNYYVWSETNEQYDEARNLFSDEDSSNWTWDPEAKAYYWHRYSRYLPELNYDSADVQLEIIKVVDFWMKIGVDGFRLPSIPFLFEEEGTTCENLPQTHAFVKKLRAHVEKHFENRILIAEANFWPEDAASYLGEGDECHMSFHYPLMPRLFLALRTEDSYPIVDIIQQTPNIPEQTQWALFLRNHDELGLDMVTDEEKNYLFKAYAIDQHTTFNVGINRRLSPLLGNDRRKVELLHAILFSLPGSPVLYYGDEIGMGDNVYLGGRAGVRTPMQWNMNINAGFSTANPQKLFLPVISDPVYRYESVNVETQQENSSSLLWWMKNIISMRNRLNAFGRGEINFIKSSNPKVISFVRSFEKQSIIVVANLSQFSQAATLDLSDFIDCDITEVFSQNRFKSIGDGNYYITVGPYGYYWFQIDAKEHLGKSEASGELPLLTSDLSWERLFHNYNEARNIERKILEPFLMKCKWFEGKDRNISKTVFQKVVAIKVGDFTHYLCIVEVHYIQQLPELYFVPMTFVTLDAIMERLEYSLQSVICRADIQGESGFIADSVYDKDFRGFLLNGIVKGQRITDSDSVLEFKPSLFTKISIPGELESKLSKSTVGSTGIIFNDKYYLKLYRKIEKEYNPDLEIVRFLSEQTSFQHSPKYTGHIELQSDRGESYVFGLMNEKVEYQIDSWEKTMDSIGRFYERVLTHPDRESVPPLVDTMLLNFEDIPELMQELLGRGFYERITRLGQRTAELHLALSSDLQTPTFAPEGFNTNYQRSLYSSLRKLVNDTFRLLEKNQTKLTPEARGFSKKVLAREKDILDFFNGLNNTRLKESRMRIHGNFHLKNVLFTGKDFVITDFEGDPKLSFAERRVKRTPFRDIASMMRSIHYAAFGKFLLNENYREKDKEILESWAQHWQHYVNRFYLTSYLYHMGYGNKFTKEQEMLMRTFLLEIALHEIKFEINNRLDWVIVPLRGIDYLMSRFTGKQQG